MLLRMGFRKPTLSPASLSLLLDQDGKVSDSAPASVFNAAVPPAMRIMD